ncbi:mitochondrial Rho GTPase 1-like protein [Tanacetum coccineum]
MDGFVIRKNTNNNNNNNNSVEENNDNVNVNIGNENSINNENLEYDEQKRPDGSWVVGDRAPKGKPIISAAVEKFPTNVPPVLPPTRLPEDMFPDCVPVMVIDTSSSLENRGKLAEELKKADAIVLTYACDRPSTLDRLSTFWLPELRRLEVNVPVIVAGCKFDLKDEYQVVSMEQVMSPIVQEFREIETCIECSAYKHMQIPEVKENIYSL